MDRRSPHHVPPEKEEALVRIAARRAYRRLKKDAATPEFSRLLQYQAASAAGDALLALGLATTLFFAVPEVTDAKTRLAAYLVLTIAPFAVVSPLLARILDRHRGSLQWAMVASAAGRATFAWWLSSRLDDLLLYPLAFGLLLWSRAGTIVKGAVLPALLPPGGSLVKANSAVSRIGAIAGILAGIPGIALLKWPGVETELLVAAGVFYVGMIPALRLPRVRGRIGSAERIGAQARARSLSVRQGLFALAGMRALVGFLVFHLAFALRREDLGAAGLGLLVGAAAAGNLVGVLAAPRLRERLREEGIMVAMLVMAGAAGIICGRFFSLVPAGVFVFIFGVAMGAAKVAFDAIVQREIPEGGRGWAFARFEAILQLAWVAGGLVPLLVSISGGPGVIAVGVASNLIGIVFVAGRRNVRLRQIGSESLRNPRRGEET
jgi:hypothetical protein